MKRWILAYLCLFGFSGLKAQDIHFSQSVNIPIWQNPAATLVNSDYRIGAIYKNQWSAVPVPYNTVLLSAEANLFMLKNNDKLNAGLVLYSDKAGDSKLSAYQLDLAVSYAKSLGDSIHYLSAGFMFGTVGRSLDFSNLFFDNQYVDGSFDPSVPVNENVDRTSFGAFDMSAGISYSVLIGSRSKIDAGFAVFHLNRANMSFYDDPDIKLDHRYHIFVKSDITINPVWQMKPLFVYQKQDTKNELLFGNILSYRINSLSITHLAAQFGLLYRNGDAIIPYAGIKYNDLLLGLSYDVNVSPLSDASNSRGGIEISAVYQISKVKKINSKGAVCPIF